MIKIPLHTARAHTHTHTHTHARTSDLNTTRCHRTQRAHTHAHTHTTCAEHSKEVLISLSNLPACGRFSVCAMSTGRQRRGSRRACELRVGAGQRPGRHHARWEPGRQARVWISFNGNATIQEPAYCLTIFLSVCVSVCVSVYLSVCLSVCLSVMYDVMYMQQILRDPSVNAVLQQMQSNPMAAQQ